MPVTNSKTTKADAKAAGRKVTIKLKPKRDATMLGIIHRAMNSAARMAVDENDSLGIPTPGTDSDGKIVYRRPPKTRGCTVDAG